jgi:hypothetical protein
MEQGLVKKRITIGMEDIVIIGVGVHRSLGRIHYIIVIIIGIVLRRKTVRRVNARRKGGLVGCWIGFERCVPPCFVVFFF